MAPAWGHLEQHLLEINAQYVLNPSYDLTPQVLMKEKN